MLKYLKKPVEWDTGFVIPPKEPGLGIELDEEVALAHTYDEKIFILKWLKLRFTKVSLFKLA